MGYLRYEAVVFDLFGTLVSNFTRREYDPVNARMAEAVGVPFSEFWRLVAETGQGFYSGVHSSVEDRIWDICNRHGADPGPLHVEKAARYRYQFMASTLVPEGEVLAALRELKEGGFQLGLISNCGPDVPLLWEQSPLARLIDIPVFSCEERVKKPDVAIYQITCHRLQVQPQQCVYVGDGGSGELTAAAAIGMLPILKRTNLSDIYDKHRPEVESWRGREIDGIGELMGVLSGLEKPCEV